MVKLVSLNDGKSFTEVFERQFGKELKVKSKSTLILKHYKTVKM